MFLFQAIPWYSVLMWFVVLGGLILANELSRRYKYVAIVSFIVLPLILTFAVWANTAVAGTSVGTWFHRVKVYSALAGCLGFMLEQHYLLLVHYP